MNGLTQGLLKELFDYRDGELYWKVRKAQRTKIGDRAGTVIGDGYRQIQIDGKRYFDHRLIFLYHHGYIPKELDHIDSDISNNSIDNLRAATRQENNRNRKKQKSHNGKPTSSIYKGVTWDKDEKKWVARIVINGKHKKLGLFISEVGAALAYDKAAIRLFGEFTSLNLSEGI